MSYMTLYLKFPFFNYICHKYLIYKQNTQNYGSGKHDKKLIQYLRVITACFIQIKVRQELLVNTETKHYYFLEWFY